MSEISRSATIMLDALLNGRVDIGLMFLREHKFVQFFNVPWHGLSASASCVELSKLFQLRMIDLQEDEDDHAVRTTIGLTRLERFIGRAVILLMKINLSTIK